jgi:hypothetical protein
VTSVHSGPELRHTLRCALSAAAQDPRLVECRAALLIDGFEVLPDGAYRSLAAFEQPALAARYFELPAPATSPLSRAAGASG